jgi:hypothetical protein
MKKTIVSAEISEASSDNTWRYKPQNSSLRATLRDTEQAGATVMYQTCIREVLDLNLGWDTGYRH